MAHAGTLARHFVLMAVVLHVLACSESEPSPLPLDGSVEEDGAVPDGGAPDASTDAEACPELPEQFGFGVCVGDVDGDAGAIEPSSGGVYSASVTGTVEPIAQSEWFCPTGSADGRHFGELSDSALYAVRGEAEAELLYVALNMPSRLPLLRAGEVVQIDYAAEVPFWMPASATIEIRDADGTLIYWFGQTTRGATELSMPDGFAASRNGDECPFEYSCGTGVVRGTQIHGLGTRIELAVGEHGELGDFTFYSLANVAVSIEANGDGWCIDQLPYDQATVLMVRTDRLVAE